MWDGWLDLTCHAHINLFFVGILETLYWPYSQYLCHDIKSKVCLHVHVLWFHIWYTYAYVRTCMWRSIHVRMYVCVCVYVCVYVASFEWSPSTHVCGMCTRMYYYIAVATPSHIPTPLLIAPTNTPVAVAVVCVDESSTDGFVFPLM